jgi:drug/metabolite transporter (DMT)-like permease
MGAAATVSASDSNSVLRYSSPVTSQRDTAVGGRGARAAWLPFAALALLALLWGYNWVVMKVGMQYAQPFTFAAIRTFLGAIFMFMLLPLLHRPVRPQALGLTIVFGLLQTGGFVGLIMWAVSIGGAGKVSILVYTMPFWLLMLAWPILGERVRGLQWAAIVFALAGLIAILGPWNLHGLKSSLLAVAAGFVWALSSVVVKIMRKKHDIDLLNLIAWQGLFGSIPLIIVAVFTTTKSVEWSGTFIAVLVFNVIPANAVTWVLWLYILHNMSTGTAGLSSLAVPLVGVLSAWIQLGERPGALEAVGMVLIVVALAILTARELAASRPKYAGVPLPALVSADEAAPADGEAGPRG